MTIDLTLEGTISGLFDHLASYFNYDIESPHAVEFDIAQDLIGFVQNAFEDNGSDSHAYCLRLHCDDDNFDSFFQGKRQAMVGSVSQGSSAVYRSDGS